MPQIHKFIAKGKTAHFFVSQWGSDIQLQELYSRFRSSAFAVGIDPDSEHFLNFMMQIPKMTYAGSGEIGILGTKDVFELPV